VEVYNDIESYSLPFHVRVHFRPW